MVVCLISAVCLLGFLFAAGTGDWADENKIGWLSTGCVAFGGCLLGVGLIFAGRAFCPDDSGERCSASHLRKDATADQGHGNELAETPNGPHDRQHADVFGHLRFLSPHPRLRTAATLTGHGEHSRKRPRGSPETALPFPFHSSTHSSSSGPGKKVPNEVNAQPRQTAACASEPAPAYGDSPFPVLHGRSDRHRCTDKERQEHRRDKPCRQVRVRCGTPKHSAACEKRDAYAGVEQ